MISGGSCDHGKIQLHHHRNKIHFKIYQTENSNISQYFCFTLFLVKNSTFVSIRNLYWKKILIVKNFWSVINHVRVYSHHIPFHTALIASEPEIVNKTTRVLKVIHSLVHPLNRTWVGLDADRDFGCVPVPLFGPHLSVIAVFTPAQKIHNIYG